MGQGYLVCLAFMAELKRQGRELLPWNCKGAIDHEASDDAALGFFVLANAMTLVRRLANE